MATSASQETSIGVADAVDKIITRAGLCYLNESLCCRFAEDAAAADRQYKQ
jgi:hypothetical protein